MENNGINFNNLNVFIGSNSSGKSNFINIFRFLRDFIEDVSVEKRGITCFDDTVSSMGGERMLDFMLKRPDNVELQKAFEDLKSEVKPEIGWLHETRCDRCGGKATTAYTVYSQIFQCPRCLVKVPLFNCQEFERETAKGKPKKMSVYPKCYQRGIVEEISTRADKFGAVPVLVSYLCESGCKPTRGERRHNDANKKKMQREKWKPSW